MYLTLRVILRINITCWTSIEISIGRNDTKSFNKITLFFTETRVNVQENKYTGLLIILNKNS